MELNLDNVINNFCGNWFTINDTSVIIFINKKLVGLSSSKNTKEIVNEELFELKNIIIKKYEKIKNEVKKDNIFAYTYKWNNCLLNASNSELTILCYSPGINVLYCKVDYVIY